MPLCPRSGRRAMLKEVQEEERRIAEFMQMFSKLLCFVACWLSEFTFGFSELVICIYEYRKHSFQGFYLAAKASASAGKHGDVMADVSVYPLNGEGVIFVAYIANMPPRIDNIHIT